MGYHTDFTGKFDFDRVVEPHHAEYIRKFNDTRRMKRDPEKAANLPDPVREAVGLPVGPEGAFFVGGLGFCGQEDDESVVDHNSAPGEVPYGSSDDFRNRYDENRRRGEALESQPGLWCKWTVTEDNKSLEWDGGEKFYYYVEWLRYLIKYFLEPWGYQLNGTVEWTGEDPGDKGVMICENNKVRTERV